MAREQEIKWADALRPYQDEELKPVSSPLEPPEFELFAQRIVSNVGQVKDYVLKSYKEAGLDPLVHAMYKEWRDIPFQVRGRVKYLLSKTASNTVMSRRELEEFLTAIIRGDERIEQRKDYRKLFPMEAVKELCKMRGYYSPIEIKSTKELVVSKNISSMSDDELMQIAQRAKAEAIEYRAEVSPSPLNEEGSAVTQEVTPTPA